MEENVRKKRTNKPKHRLEKIKEIKHKKRKKGIIIFIIILLIGLITAGALYIMQNPDDNIFLQAIEKIQSMKPEVPPKEENVEKQSEQKEEQKNKEEEEKEKQKEKAVKAALKKFKELGETVNESQIEVLRIQRSGKIYYYISAPKNTVEVSIEDYSITRVNGVPTEN